jgi:hypothetical protein
MGFGIDFELEPAAAPGSSSSGEEAPTVIETLVVSSRCNSQEAMVTGSLTKEAPGTWVITFDNSYSFFTDKTVYCMVSEESPSMPSGANSPTAAKGQTGDGAGDTAGKTTASVGVAAAVA